MNKRLILSLIVSGLVFCLLLPGTNKVQATGTTYYVDSVSGNDANAGTSASAAWKTLGKINGTSFTAGSTILFKRGGSWDGGLTLASSGTSNAPITIDAYGTGADPVLTHTNNSTYAVAITVTGQWIVIQHVNVENSFNAGIQITAASGNVIVQNIEAGNSGFGVDVRASNVKVLHSYIHDLKMIRNTATPTNDDYGAVGVALNSDSNAITNIEIAYNTIARCKDVSYDYGYDGGAVEIWRKVTSLNVHHNWFEGNKGVMEIGGQGETIQDIHFDHNIAIDNRLFLLINSAPTNVYKVTVINVTIENNTIVETKENTSPFWFDGAQPSESTVLAKNNIFYMRARMADFGTFYHHYNLYYDYINPSNIGYTINSDEISADPQFTDITNHNFRLKPTSPAVDRGSNLNYTLDFLGAPANINFAPDIGAIEYNPCLSDINHDGTVDISDYARFVPRLFTSWPDSGAADINGDNIVDLSDYHILTQNSLKSIANCANN